MNERTFPSSQLRDVDHQEIDEQIQEFLDRGGEIEQITQSACDAKPIGKVWKKVYAGSFEV